MKPHHFKPKELIIMNTVIAVALTIVVMAAVFAPFYVMMNRAAKQ